MQNGKRGFRLVDKEETVRESVQNGKNIKVGLEENIICEEMVKKVNHKWPQLDQ